MDIWIPTSSQKPRGKVNREGCRASHLVCGLDRGFAPQRSFVFLCVIPHDVTVLKIQIFFQLVELEVMDNFDSH